MKDENRKLTLIVVLCMLYVLSVGMSPQDKKQANSGSSPTYQSDILPMLTTNCQPCHFEGGKVFGKLPFTEFKTVKTLGKKLTTRLQDKEKQEQRELVLSWVKNGLREK